LPLHSFKSEPCLKSLVCPSLLSLPPLSASKQAAAAALLPVAAATNEVAALLPPPSRCRRRHRTAHRRRAAAALPPLLCQCCHRAADAANGGLHFEAISTIQHQAGNDENHFIVMRLQTESSCKVAAVAIAGIKGKPEGLRAGEES
jgi:hypothetical protein